jgi:hypothetical protein
MSSSDAEQSECRPFGRAAVLFPIPEGMDADAHRARAPCAAARMQAGAELVQAVRQECGGDVNARGATRPAASAAFRAARGFSQELCAELSGENRRDCSAHRLVIEESTPVKEFNVRSLEPQYASPAWPFDPEHFSREWVLSFAIPVILEPIGCPNRFDPFVERDGIQNGFRMRRRSANPKTTSPDRRVDTIELFRVTEKVIEATIRVFDSGRIVRPQEHLARISSEVDEIVVPTAVATEEKAPSALIVPGKWLELEVENQKRFRVEALLREDRR